ncbi:uncharacterized protein E0L32_003204 [Thyridium curvatum]|uniref:Uncharacterized protein n=1 Tax=Thyridium curvatum TaxID=1093900 RepID=A0A507BCV1_9PEZI|nr:uncharacterized protein E0L32_003204 [Thyridium curvatum]TPX17086.1 hypothetical protein E0L32_003204 [Thyridium curvatum]
MANVDVLIVGGGPTGMALALELSMQDVSYRIIDKAPVRSDKSRALVVQARTLELLNRHGTAKKLLSRGFELHGANLYTNKREAGTVSLDGLDMADTEFPFPLCVPQQETEHFLDECLAKYDKSIERPVIAKAITQDGAGVTVKLENERTGLSETLRVRYVVGCDGAHSSVRHAGRFRFEGAPYPQTFILGDFHVSDSSLPRDRLLLCFGSATLAMFPLKEGKWRLVTIHDGSKELQAHGTVLMDEQPTVDEFRALFAEMAPPGAGTLHDPTWLAKYHLHHRVADQYRDGRLFVAGDASNIHSPAGGQGMNTGMQDAFNLGWKLGRVLRGEARDALLDTYDAERRPVGQNVVDTTDRMFSYATWQNPVWRMCRNLLLPWVLPWLTNSAKRRAAGLRYISELTINYRGSSVVYTAGGFSGPVEGGDRLRDGKLRSASGDVVMLQSLCDGPSSHLLLFAGVGQGPLRSEEFAGFEAKLSKTDNHVKVIRIFNAATDGEGAYSDLDGQLHARYGMASPGYVLVRPDAYVGCIGNMDAFDELLSFMGSGKF